MSNADAAGRPRPARRDLRHACGFWWVVILLACGPKASGTAGDSAGDGGTGTSTASGTAATSAVTSGGTGGVGECRTDDDCTVVDDCCNCLVASPLVDPEPCDVPECEATECAAHGFRDPQAVCFGGVCRFREVSCDPALVVCDAEPPACLEGWLPRVSPAGCWDGCVPVSACDTVPDCSYCSAGEVCVVSPDLSGTHRDCEPLPAGCSADDPCGCSPAFCPEGQQCQVPAAGQVECICPDCAGP